MRVQCYDSEHFTITLAHNGDIRTFPCRVVETVEGRKLFFCGLQWREGRSGKTYALWGCYTVDADLLWQPYTLGTLEFLTEETRRQEALRTQNYNYTKLYPVKGGR